MSLECGVCRAPCVAIVSVEFSRAKFALFIFYYNLFIYCSEAHVPFKKNKQKKTFVHIFLKSAFQMQSMHVYVFVSPFNIFY